MSLKCFHPSRADCDRDLGHMKGLSTNEDFRASSWLANHEPSSAALAAFSYQATGWMPSEHDQNRWLEVNYIKAVGTSNLFYNLYVKHQNFARGKLRRETYKRQILIFMLSLPQNRSKSQVLKELIQ